MTTRSLAALTAAAWLVSGPFSAADQTFRTGVDGVRVDVLVTEGGRPVGGLKASDFELLDNGVPQEIRELDFGRLPLNVVLAFDLSASVTPPRLATLQRAASALLDGFAKQDRAALVTFSHVVSGWPELTGDLASIGGALRRAQPSGSTALIDGAYAGLLIGQSDVGRSLLVVFSDGVDTASWLTQTAVLDCARRSDVVVYSVAVGPHKAKFLRDLSDATGGRAFENETVDNLDRLFPSILEEFRRRYLLMYTPAGVAKTGWHTLQVRVKSRRARVQARPGYLAGS